MKPLVIVYLFLIPLYIGVFLYTVFMKKFRDMVWLAIFSGIYIGVYFSYLSLIFAPRYGIDTYQIEKVLVIFIFTFWITGNIAFLLNLFVTKRLPIKRESDEEGKSS